MKKISIAIDGPSAAGKSTIAKRVAKALNYIYIDTGAMYRCVAYHVDQHHVDFNDEDQVVSLLESCDIALDQEGGVYLNGKDVRHEIRTERISKGASSVSRYEKVRAFLVDKQRFMAQGGGVILDGRDIGSVVLPNAELKIYQVASVETRAQRRYQENLARGMACQYEQIEKDIIQRDEQDMHREHSPLKKADDAILLDTSSLTIEEVTDKVLALAKTKEQEK